MVYHIVTYYLSLFPYHVFRCFFYPMAAMVKPMAFEAGVLRVAKGTALVLPSAYLATQETPLLAPGGTPNLGIHMEKHGKTIGTHGKRRKG